jgi:hypothetical protein
MRIGVFAQANPVGTPIMGGAQAPCVDIAAGSDTMRGYFLTLSTSATFDIWLTGHFDDFNTGSQTGPGSLLSLENLLIPAKQKLEVKARQYAVEAPAVEFNYLIEAPPNTPPYSCSTGRDGGVDAGPDAQADAGGDARLEDTGAAEPDSGPVEPSPSP